MIPVKVDSDMWADIQALTDWLNQANGCDDHELTMRVGKLAEEVGEAWAARIGMLGQNPRKGATHTAADLAGELCDVIVTASVALTSLLGDATEARRVLADKLGVLQARADENLGQRADDWVRVTGKAGAA
jgi:hypothetical protein